ncbi:cysteine--tRNA ligase [Candidatus Nomurabacteria bacterium RIFCSPHIGHO2_01_FULL_40_20]|uniref:Cysteine--tRNA ligase n=1 Tax=Candidatus Nomurabacteria bacterium RIFCSPHIGHO2_01_FULL_40_20 TaxID=1801738 RepID=A0A1F6V4G3_9BACT|nr:MAG: cysteine--tRNA ligase [Candidatus Nomurabacteria bacterium RIFCSPHIGHO2_01_FULL_40_20]
MSIQFYNTLTRQKEEFVPINASEVKFYSCGPTVYNYPHIGNYRAYTFADILKRVLLYNDYKVKHIMNITDIDDKTIRDSQKEGKSLKEFTEFYTEGFLEDVKKLNILPPEKFTKATDYVDEMVKIVETLLKKGIAYKSEDGSIYYDIKKFPNYGKLSRLVLEEQKENASGRIKTDEYDKENAQDFALWKAWDENDGEVFWTPPFAKGGGATSLGKGRPGWHIECSAMSMANLGEQIDVHTGGVDNIFPHHENEIAQSEGATGKQFVKYWVHNEWVLVDGKKMAKSAHNFYTLKDLTDKGIDPLVYRFWLLMANYGTRVNFVWDALKASEVALKRLQRLYLELGPSDAKALEGKEEVGRIDENYKKKFKEHVSNDLDTPRGLSTLWDLIKDENIPDADKKATILDFDKVLGLGFADLKEDIIPEEITKLVNERALARQNKDFKLSDDLRTQINSLGFDVKDTDLGQKVSKI